MAANLQNIPARLVQIRKLLRFACARGFALFDELDSNSDQFTTSGVLLNVKRNRKKVFAVLTDGRDHIQLIFSEQASGPYLQTLQRGTRVSVTGIPFLSGRNEDQAKPSLFVTNVHSLSSPAPVRFDEDGLRYEVLPRVLVGHLMAFVSGQLERMFYIRYEPQLITGSTIDLDTQPLMVRFPGRGADVFLEVSPLPQLLYAAVTMGIPKLYAPTRLFSRAYRDGFTSADSPIVAAVEVELTNQPKPPVEEMAQALISSLSEVEDTGLPFELIPESSKDAVTIVQNKLPVLGSTTSAYDIEKRVDVLTSSGQTIIEAHEGKIAQTIRYHWLCVHIERLVLADLWRVTQRRGLEPGMK